MTIDDGSCAIPCEGAQNITFFTLNNMGSGSAQQFDTLAYFTYSAFGASPVIVEFTDGDMEAGWDEL